MQEVTDRSHDLRSAIEASGYYPDVVADALAAAVAGEAVEAHLVHHEPTIDERDEVRRHVTVLVLTPTRLILAHTDEHAPDDILPAPYTSSKASASCAGVGCWKRRCEVWRASAASKRARPYTRRMVSRTMAARAYTLLPYSASVKA